MVFTHGDLAGTKQQVKCWIHYQKEEVEAHYQLCISFTPTNQKMTLIRAQCTHVEKPSIKNAFLNWTFTEEILHPHGGPFEESWLHYNHFESEYRGKKENMKFIL